MGLDAVTKAVDAYLQIAASSVHLNIDPVAARVGLAFLTTLIFGHVIIEHLFRAGAREAEEKLSEGAKSGIYGLFYFSSLVLVPLMTYLDVILGSATAVVMLVALPYYYGTNIRKRLAAKDKRNEKKAVTVTNPAIAMPAPQQIEEVGARGATPAVVESVSVRAPRRATSDKPSEKLEKNAGTVGTPAQRTFSTLHIVAPLKSLLGKLKKPGKEGTKNTNTPKPTAVAQANVEEQTTKTEKKNEQKAGQNKKAEKTDAEKKKKEAEKIQKDGGKTQKGGLLSGILGKLGARSEEPRPRKTEAPKIRIEEIEPEGTKRAEKKLNDHRIRIPAVRKGNVEEIRPEMTEKNVESEQEPAKQTQKIEEKEEKPAKVEAPAEKTQGNVPPELEEFRRVLSALEDEYILHKTNEAGKETLKKSMPKEKQEKSAPQSSKTEERKEKTAEREIKGTAAAKKVEKTQEQRYSKTTYSRIESALKNLLFEQEKAKLDRVTWREVRELRKKVEEMVEGYHNRIAEEAAKLGDRPSKNDVENAARRILGLPEKQEEKKERGTPKERGHRRREERKQEEERKENVEDDLFGGEGEDLAGLLGGESGGDEGDLAGLLGGDEEEEGKDDLEKLLGG